MLPARTRAWGLAISAAISVAIGGTAGAAENNPVRKQPIATAAAAGGERVIVKFRASSSTGAKEKSTTAGTAALAQRHSLTLKQARQIGPNLHLMRFEHQSSGDSLDTTLERLRADAAVEYAEPDRRRYAHAIPNDPLYSAQWYLQKSSTTPSAIDATSAWDISTGRTGVIIADLDTGVLFDHPDLQRAAANGRLLTGYDFVTDTSIANDGDGRDADATDPGDWVTTAEVGTAFFEDCSVSDSSWHGTRVAGILGALTNNATGVAGVTWSNAILPVRVLGKCGGYDSDIIAAMLWAGGIHVDGVPDNPTPAKIENLSLGSTGTSCPRSYQDAVNQLAAVGVLVVASAGNEGGPVDVPANCAGVAGIAGLRHAGTKVGFSSLGPAIAVSAPGGNCVNVSGACLYSIDTTYNLGDTVATTNSYTNQLDANVGTSFSAPIVAGMAGLMASVNGNLNAAQLISRLKEGATKPFPVSSDPSIPQCHVPTGSNDLQAAECNCTTQTCGAGMANAKGAVDAALRPIAAVTLPTTVSAGQNVVLQASGSAAACGYTISSYAWTPVGNSTAIQGSNTATATVIAPTSDSYTVRLTVIDNNGRQDTADVVIGSNTVSSSAPVVAGANACASTSAGAVTVSPASATLQAGSGQQTFTATVTNTSATTVTWQVDGVTGGNATVGTISTAGLYTAPATMPSPATVTVTAIATANTTVSGSAQVTITPAPAPARKSSGGGGGFDIWSLLFLLLLLISSPGHRGRTKEGAFSI